MSDQNSDLSTTGGNDTTQEYRDLTEPRKPLDPLPLEVRAVARANALKRIWMVIAGILALSLVSFMGYTTYLIRDTQVKNRSVISGTNAAADVIKGCTIPGEACYEQSQKQLVEAVTGVNTVTIRATSCLVVLLNATPPDVKLTTDQIARTIKACVMKGNVSVEDLKKFTDEQLSGGAGSDAGKNSSGSSSSPPHSTTSPSAGPSTAPGANPPSAPSPSLTPTPTPEQPRPPLLPLPGTTLCLLGLCIL